MYSNNDVSGVYSFLNTTPEGQLRKMLVGGKLTEAHFKLLLKMSKGCKETEFIDMFLADTFDKVTVTPRETPLKEFFWSICKDKLEGMGLLSLTNVKAAA